MAETIESVWGEFSRKFVELWRAEAQGDAYPATLFMGEAGAARLEGERQAYMTRLFQDMVGFAAAKIIRRILGLAHNIDFEWIEMLVDTLSFGTIRAVTKAARELRDWQPDLP